MADVVPEGSIEALAQSFAMIIVSEIGDKTFLIAAILAMRHPRLTVFLGAFGSLVVMSILSAAMGHVLPSLIPRKWTQALAGLLFLVFGAKMMVEARQMKPGNDKIAEEMREAEEEIEGDDAAHDGTGGRVAGDVIPLEEMEEGGGRALPHAHSKSSSTLMEGARNFCSLFLGPVFVQAFILTFLGEWGDRSQIATIALGAAHVRPSQLSSMSLTELQNVYLVSLGTIVGHACCTALAVIGGRYVSTKISVKHGTFSFLFAFWHPTYATDSHSRRSGSLPIIRRHLPIRILCRLDGYRRHTTQPGASIDRRCFPYTIAIINCSLTQV